MRDVVPAPVFDEIQDHLREKGNEAQGGWEAGSDEEDTLTGHVGAVLQTEWSPPLRVDNAVCQWRIRYKKFRGRGPHAFEKESGADGIVQIEVATPAGPLVHKGVLFQAKKGDARRDRKLSDQLGRMEVLAEGGSAVFVYRENGYRAIRGRDLLEHMPSGAVARRDDDGSQRFGTYLADTFLPCDSGVRGMYFDAVRRILFVPSESGVVAIPLDIGHRIGIDVVGNRTGS